MATSNDFDATKARMNPTVTQLGTDQRPSTAPPGYHPSTSPFPSTASTKAPSSEGVRLIDRIRHAVSLLTVLMAITILSCIAHAISVYYDTALRRARETALSVWPYIGGNMRGEITIMIASAIVVVATVIGFIMEKLCAHRDRSNVVINPFAWAIPICGLIVSIIAASIQSVSNASDDYYTIQTWSCENRDIKMRVEPNWGRLCTETEVALYLTYILIPLEVGLLGLAFASMAMRRHGRDGLKRKEKEVQQW